MPAIFDRYRVVDVDTHVTEPHDVWIDRVPKKWGDLVPHVVKMGRKEMWMIGDKPFMPAGITATAGFDGLINVVETLSKYWFDVVKLPTT